MTPYCPYCGQPIPADDIKIKLVDSAQMRILEQCKKCQMWFGVMMNRKDELVFFEIKKKK